MDKLSERQGTFSQAYTPNYKSHVKLRSTNHVKGGLNRAVLSKKSSEVLSPLVLNPSEEVESSESHFTLEEPVNKKEEKLSNFEAETEMTRHYSLGGNVKMHRFNQEMHAGRSNTYLAGIMKDWKPQSFLISSSSTSKRTSQGSFLYAFSSSDDIDYRNYSENVDNIPCSSLETKHQGETSVGNGKIGSNLQKEQFADCHHDLLAPNANCRHSPFPQRCMTHMTGEVSSCSEEGMDAPSDLNCKPTNSALVVAKPSFEDQRVLTSGMELAIVADQPPPRNLSQKFRPRSFDELVGQDIVVQALSSAVMKGKIAPVYLFHGSRGTGKTSTARILAAALNCCMINSKRRPCMHCSQCKALAIGKSSSVCEVDAASHNGVSNVYTLVQRMLSTSKSSRYKVLIIDECHMLTEETWNALLYFLEEPPGDFVFVLITTDADSLPGTASSRCQKFFFTKVKHSEILTRLSKLANLEGIDAEHEALDLIASQSDGSMRDAEMTLDQLSLSGHMITYSAVLDLVSPLSDDKLLNLLDLALGSDTVRTVQKAKELVDSGVEPLHLMTCLARLITDILAGSHKVAVRNSDHFILTHMGSKEGLEGLSSALKTLLEAEKQVKSVHQDRMAWLTAALLQLGCYQNQRHPCSSSTTIAVTHTTSPFAPKNLKWTTQKGRRRTKWANTGSIPDKPSPDKCDADDWATRFTQKPRTGKSNLEARVHPFYHPLPTDTTQDFSVDSSEGCSSPYSSKGSERCTNLFGPGNLGSLWINILKGCKSLPLRHLLSHGRLSAVCFSTVEAMVHLEFKDPEQKSRAERYRMVIANTCKKWLGLSVNVKISLACEPVNEACKVSPLPLLGEHKQEHKNFLEGSLQPHVFKETESAQWSKIERGSLHHWQDQAETNIIGFDYPAYNGPFDHVSASPLRAQTLNRTSLGSNQDFCMSEAFLGNKKRSGMTLAGKFDELAVSETLYWQDLPCQEQQDSTFKYSESADDHLDPKLMPEGDQCVQRLPCTAVQNLENESSRSIDISEHESQGLESQAKYEKLFCWRMPREEKSLKRRKRRCRALINCLPCGKVTS